MNIRQKHATRRDRQRRNSISSERLETRMLLSAVSWDGGGDGVKWSDKNNWSNNLVPTIADDVTINVAANPTIHIDTGVQSIHSLNSSELLAIDSNATLAISTTSQISKNLTLNGGTLLNGTLTASAGAKIVVNSFGGILDGATINANIDLTSASSPILMVKNNLTLNGVMSIGLPVAGFPAATVYFGDGSATPFSLSGNAEIVFGNNTSSAIINPSIGLNAAGALTFGPNVLIHGNSGRIVNTNVQGSIVNQGSIISDGGGTFNVGNGTGRITSTGTMKVNSGSSLTSFNFSGAISAAALTGATSSLNVVGDNITLATPISAAGGANVLVSGLSAQSLPALSATGAGSTVFISGTDLTNAGGSTVANGGKMTVDGLIGNLGTVTLTGASTTTSLSGSNLTNNGGLTIPNATTGFAVSGLTGNLGTLNVVGTGPILINGSTLVNNSGIAAPSNSDITITGLTGNLGALSVGTGAKVKLTSADVMKNQAVNVGQNASLTIDHLTGNLGSFTFGQNANVVLRGVNMVVNSGLSTGAGVKLTLGGTWSNAVGSTIAATGSTLTLGDFSNAWTNNGTITPVNTVTNLAGAMTQASIGALTADPAGFINITGTITGNLALSNTTGPYVMAGGTLKNGTLTQSGNGKLQFSGSAVGGTFDNMVVNGNLDMSFPNAALLNVVNDLEVNGIITMGNPLTSFAILRFLDSGPNGQTLSGNATINFAFTNNSLNSIQNLMTGVGVAGTLTIAPTVTLIGASAIISNQEDTGTIINQGIITANDPSGFIQFGSPNGGKVINAGTINANNGTFKFVGRWDNNGTVNILNNGKLILDGQFLTADIGTVNRTGGTVTILGTLAGNLVLSAATGSVNFGTGATLKNGLLSQSGGAKLLFSGTAGTFDNVSTVTGDIDLDLVNNYQLTIFGDIAINGKVRLGKADGTIGATIKFAGGGATGQTVSGNAEFITGAADSGAAWPNQLLNTNTAASTAGMLTFANTVNIHGKQLYLTSPNSNATIINKGSISTDVTGGILLLGNSSQAKFINQGTIQAIAGTTLGLGSNWSNTGTVTATNATVYLDGIFNKSTFGTFNRTGGTVTFRGIMNGGFDLNASTGSWIFNQGTFKGGTLNLTGGATLTLDVAGNAGGKFDNLTVNGDLFLGSNFNPVIEAQNGLVYNGTITIDKGGLVFTGNAPQTFSGNANVVFANSVGGNGVSVNSSAQVTFASSVFIHGKNGSVDGNGKLINHANVSADVAGGTINFVALTSDGTLSALNGAMLRVLGPTTNTGVINLNNGTLWLGGTFTQASIGTINRTGTTKVLIGGTLTGGLTTDATTGDWNLDDNGIIQGGTVFTNDGTALRLDLLPGSNPPKLDGVTVNGTIVVHASLLTVLNSLTLNGTMYLSNINGTETGHVSFSTPNSFLHGNATVVFSNEVQSSQIAAAGTFTIDPTVTIRGMFGNITTGGPGTIVNKGLITSDVAGGQITIYNTNFVNQGIIEAAPGKFEIQNTATFTQQDDGAITIGIGGNSAGNNYGRIVFTNSFVASGTINTVLTGGYVPNNGDTFDVITYSSQTGDFATKNFNTVGGKTFTSAYTASAMRLTSASGGPTFATLAGNAMTVTGTANPDTIDVTDALHLLKIVRNGTTMVFHSPAVASVAINALGGDDKIYARDNRLETIDGGTGTNTARTDDNDIVTNIQIFENSSIYGTFFKDLNSNGVWDGNDAGMPGWTAYIDANNNGALDAGEQSRISNEPGSFFFENLSAGTYYVRQVNQTGYRRSFPVPPTNVHTIVIPGIKDGTNHNADFGDTTNVWLAGKVFNDVNSNNVQDNGEAGLDGVTVNIVSNGVVVASRVTDLNGFWQVKGLGAGTGSVEIALPAGYTIKYPISGSYVGTMTSGEGNQQINFGLHKTGAAPLAAPAPAIQQFTGSEDEKESLAELLEI